MLSQPDIWCRPPAERFAGIIALLRQLIGPLGHRRVNPLLNIAIYARLGFLLRRFAQILARPTPPKPRIRPHTPQSQAAKPAPPATNTTKLPTRYGWMLRLYPGHQIPGARSQLAHLLTEPDMIALITAHPSLGRVLRPLCHMLHLAPPPHLALPRKPPPVTPRQPRAKPARPPRAQHRPSRSTSECRPLWGLHDLPARPRNNRA